MKGKCLLNIEKGTKSIIKTKMNKKLFYDVLNDKMSIGHLPYIHICKFLVVLFQRNI